MEFIKWNNRPGQAEGEETSSFRRVATTEVLIHGFFYYIEIQSKLTGNTTKAFRVTSDLPEFVSQWGPTLTGARQTAVQWASQAVMTKAQNIFNMDWWIGVAAMPVGKMVMPVIIGGYADTTRGRIGITRNGTGQWQVGRTNDLTWETEPTLTGEFQAYTEHLWDAVATAAAWVKNKQEEHDAAITDAMLAIAKADAVAIATANAEALEAERLAQWGREVDAEQKAVLRRSEAAFPVTQETADAVVVQAVVAKAAVVKMRSDGTVAGTSSGWMPFDGGAVWIREYRKLGTGASDWAVSITVKVEEFSNDGLPLAWCVIITETVRNNTTCNDAPLIRMQVTRIRTKTAAQKLGEEYAAKYVQWNRGRDRIYAALDKSTKAS